MAAGVIQWYGNSANGKFYTAGGDIIQDADGITLPAEEFPSVNVLRWLSDDNQSMVGRIFSTYGGISTDAGIVMVGRAHDASTQGFALLWAEDDEGNLKSGLNVTTRKTMYFTTGDELLEQSVAFISRADKTSFPGMSSERMLAAETEIFGITDAALTPYSSLAIGAGTLTAAVNAPADHPGVAIISSAAGANTGYNIGLINTALWILAGGEIFELIATITNTTNLVGRFGFLDTQTTTAPTDGAWIDIAGTTVTGKTNDNTTPSTTGTSYTLSAGQWYRFKIYYDGTTVHFYVYDLSNVLQWSDTLTTTIPTGAGRSFGVNALLYKTTVTGVELGRLDWMSFRNTRLMRNSVDS
jgi:hypothetical protein